MPPSESESSLPTNAAGYIPSSPPAATNSKELFGDMDNNQNFKSEGHGAEATRKPIRRSSSTDTERPPSAQRVHQDEHDRQLSEHEEEEKVDQEYDPANKILDFNWEALAERYHASMQECEINEAELMQEFEKLMNYFRIWVESGHAQDTGRTFSRLQTRSLHVQNSEAKLEKTRNHYTQVVHAFESAMTLLGNMN